MILPFSTQINGKPTYFVERIHKGIRENYMLAPVDPSVYYPPNYNFVAKDKLPAKLHTIREDKNNRWKVGTKIDFFINARQKNMFRFAPVLPVVRVQEVEIIYDKFFGKTIFPEILIDNLRLHPDKIDDLAQNDGFDTVEDFLAYFDKDFKGKLIHWTDLKY